MRRHKVIWGRGIGLALLTLLTLLIAHRALAQGEIRRAPLKTTNGATYLGGATCPPPTETGTHASSLYVCETGDVYSFDGAAWIFIGTAALPTTTGAHKVLTDTGISQGWSARPRIGDLTWPASDGSAGQLMVTDGSGVLGFTDAALAALTDVTLTSPMDGEVLTYDAGSGTWINAAASGGGSGSSLSTPAVTGSDTADPITLTAGNSVDGNAGGLTLTAGTATGNGPGGTLTLTAGSSGTGAEGALLFLQGGGNAPGGTLTLIAGSGGTGAGGALLFLQGGDQDDPEIGGAITLTAGVGTGAGGGGGFSVTSGNADAGNGGPIRLIAGTAAAGDGGEVLLSAGTSVDGTAGSITLTAGSASGMGTGGAITLHAGASTDVTTPAADVNITGGNAPAYGMAGNVSLQTDAGNGIQLYGNGVTAGQTWLLAAAGFDPDEMANADGKNIVLVPGAPQNGGAAGVVLISTLACPSGQTAPLSVDDTGAIVKGSCS